MASDLVEREKARFNDVTEAVRLLVRQGATLSLKHKTIGLKMSNRGLKTLAAADYACSVYGMKLIRTDA